MFEGIDPHRFAFQSALRVREPSFINQGDLDLCGPNSIVIAFAKRDPEGYAHLCVDLMRKGSGYFGDMKIKASDALLARKPLLQLHDADYVVLASLRADAGFFDYLTFDQNNGSQKLSVPTD